MSSVFPCILSLLVSTKPLPFILNLLTTLSPSLATVKSHCSGFSGSPKISADSTITVLMPGSRLSGAYVISSSDRMLLSVTSIPLRKIDTDDISRFSV